MKYFWVLFVIFLLSACTAKLSSIRTDVDNHLGSEEGYLLMAINTNLGLSKLHVSGTQSFSLSYKDLRRGSNYVLLNLPAGDYEFMRVNYNQLYYFDINNTNDWSFKIQPGVISYVGDLEIDSVWQKYSYVELVNNSSLAMDFMESRFANILKSRKIIYQGPGEDDFFDYISQVESKEQLQ